MTESERQDLYARAISLWGANAQIRMLQEECGELVAMVNRFDRKRCGVEDVAAEVADVMILCEQARLITGGALVDEAIAFKLERLLGRVEIAEGSK
jgi:NTP pyrophosphatase (non-canonical NTP hydrolase)